jgi:hypothetical protein
MTNVIISKTPGKSRIRPEEVQHYIEKARQYRHEFMTAWVSRKKKRLSAAYHRLSSRLDAQRTS